MTLSAGVIIVSLASLAVTWSMFGRGDLRLRRNRFFYWIKSTLLLGVALTDWSQYNEPAVSFVLLAALNFTFSALLNMCDSNGFYDSVNIDPSVCRD